ncbi:MAG TPA: DciA family protein [Castellaniella sp.]|uniref:DciA family protein n=1 Tax=Castellaniella sp. TaxID=1955812 RepID=UPI002F1502D0
MSKNSSQQRSRQAGVQALRWLDRSTSGAPLLTKAHELLALEHALTSLLPAGLARHVHVSQRDGPLLIVMVPGPAYAARLRQMVSGVARRLQDAGWPVEQIVVRIDARGPLPRTEKPLRDIQPLDTQALQSFEALGRQVAPGPLADAIHRLLEHHERGAGDLPHKR